MKNIFLTLIFFFLFTFSLFSQTSILGTEHIEAKLLEVETLISQQDYSSAISILKSIEAEDPENRNVLFNLGLCYLQIGRADVTKRYLSKYIELEKKDYAAHNLLGIAFENLGETDSSFVYFNKAIKINSKASEAYFNRGRLYFSQSKFELALKDFLKAKSDDKNFNLSMMLAQTYYALGKYAEALKEYKISLNLKPNDFLILKNLGNTASQLKDFKAAIEYYSQALEIQDDDVDILNNRMLCYNELEDSENSEKDAQRIKDIQAEKGVQISMLQYKMIKSEDDILWLRIPKNWRAFVSDNAKTKDSVIIKFFNPDFENNVSQENFTYSFGGELKIIKNISLDTSQSINMARAAISEKYEMERLEETQQYYLYKPTFRKIFNPTEKLNQGLVKAECQETQDLERRIIHEYHAVTNNGWLITLYVWLPEQDSFYYEKLLDFIIESLQINI